MHGNKHCTSRNEPLTGVPFVPIDVKATPVERAKMISRDCKPGLLLTQREVAVSTPLEIHGVPSIYVEEERPDYGSGNQKHTFEPFEDDTMLAYVMYTSGSTGKPKGGARKQLLRAP